LRIDFLENRCVPSTITPTTFDDGGLGSGSLRDAVLQFNADSGTDDDTIQLLAGTYTLTIRNVSGLHETTGLTGDLNLTQTSHHWIIQGAGSSGDNATVIDAGQLRDRVFQIVTPGTQVVFRDLIIQGGLAQEDGSDGALAGTTDALGGGILNTGGNVTLDNLMLRNNVAQAGDVASLGVAGHNAWGGGFYSTGGALTMTEASIANNQAVGGRGGNGDYGTYYHHTPAGNGGAATGAGLYASGGSLDISGSTIATNHATGGRGGDGYLTHGPSGTSYYAGVGSGGFGGAGGLYVSGGSLTIATSAITSNQATGGPGGYGGYAGDAQGGGLLTGTTGTVSNSTLSANSVTGLGDGIYNAYTGTLTVSNCTLSANGIYNGGTLTVSNCTLSSGGIGNQGMLMVSNSTVSGNSATGIFNGIDGTATVSDSTVYGNSGGLGGGISNYGTLTVTGSSVSGNSASGSYGDGGGIYSAYYSTLTVSNSTLSGNSAAHYGGGIEDESAVGVVTLTNVTLTANRAATGGGNTPGGGVFVYHRSPVLHNTLIAGNFNGPTGTTRDDVFGALDPGSDYNLIGDGTGMTGVSDGVNGNLVGSADAPIDPLLGPLQDNGGPTPTHALLAGSPAIDAGNNAYATDWDQRGPGYPRIVNGIIDIGAFEYQGDGSGPATLAVPPSLLLRGMGQSAVLSSAASATGTPIPSEADPGMTSPGSDAEHSSDHRTLISPQENDRWRVDTLWDHPEIGDPGPLLVS
jgi:hypothetical protein